MPPVRGTGKLQSCKLYSTYPHVVTNLQKNVFCVVWFLPGIFIFCLTMFNSRLSWNYVLHQSCSNGGNHLLYNYTITFSDNCCQMIMLMFCYFLEGFLIVVFSCSFRFCADPHLGKSKNKVVRKLGIRA